MIRAWLVDDEALAIRRLARLLTENGKVEIAGTSTDPAEALARLNTIAVDAIFLDIEMPGMNGFELLALLEPKPAVVFATAYDQYAVKAFEANGADYLLKPVTAEALGRAVARLERKPAFDPTILDRLTQALARANRSYPRRIASKLGERTQFIELDSVTHFFADGKLTYAATAGKNYVVDDSIVQLESKLDPSQFHRIHRGHLVNLSAITEICAWFGGGMIAKLNDPARTELPIARDRVRTLKDRLGI